MSGCIRITSPFRAISYTPSTEIGLRDADPDTAGASEGDIGSFRAGCKDQAEL
jgi:hypothetical protein